MNDMQQVLELPVICTRGMLVFPGNSLSLDVGRPKSLNAINDASNLYERKILFVSQIVPIADNVEYKDVYHVGTLCRIKKRIRKDSSGVVKLTVDGIKRVRLHNLITRDNCLYSSYEILEDIPGDVNEEVALVRKIASYLENNQATGTAAMPRDVLQSITSGLSAGELADKIAHNLPMKLDQKQKILEEVNVNDRLMLVASSIASEQMINEIEQNINRRVKESIDENQREYYLREKIRAIKDELGETPGGEDDVDALKKMVEENPYPEHVKEKARDEIHRYEMMPAASQEANVVRNYLDWLLKTPWYQETTDREDLVEVERILNEDHYGLEKVKERILEHLAVKQMTHSLKAPILCLYGPPGVGKTSLATSIARALDRKFVKASLGGVTDESEIRGHRRTYLGSMPGRIIQGMKKAGVVNPVFLLDEVDKLSSDYKGDPTSALLEVLDPEQNSLFSDNYIEEPYDLSKVLFIATANTLDTIPAPLRDRMEIIELSSYTEQEKYMIAKDHLVPKQLKNHGLTSEQLSFSKEAIMEIIQHYTREAGVRQLERLIAQVCRKVDVKILKQEGEVFHIEKEDIETYLGKQIFDHTKKLSESQIGVVTGLAYTQYGGDILPIEVNHYKGTGKMVLTGQLGDVMKESASIAYSYVRSNTERYGISSDLFEKEDIHIHVPEGAVPKDGPSAGVTLTTAIYSALTNKPVRNDVAMTGEITLRGNVLPIGGLKEKSISAHRSGIKKIVIPKDNYKDIDEIPQEVRDDLEIVLADNIDTVLENALL